MCGKRKSAHESVVARCPLYMQRSCQLLGSATRVIAPSSCRPLSRTTLDMQVRTCLYCSHCRMDDLYRAIADPTRRAILDELVERDGQSLYELCGRLTMKHGIGSTRQAISQHLEVLESAGLVEVRREGRYKFHWFNGQPLRAIEKRWPTDRNGA